MWHMGKSLDSRFQRVPWKSPKSRLWYLFSYENAICRPFSYVYVCFTVYYTPISRHTWEISIWTWKNHISMCCANVSTTIFVPKLQLVGHVSPCVMFPLLAACADSDVAKVPLGSTVVHGASTQLGGTAPVCWNMAGKWTINDRKTMENPL